MADNARVDYANQLCYLDRYQEAVIQAEHDLPLPSCLGAGQCPMCGASHCVCAEMGDTYTNDEWTELEASA